MRKVIKICNNCKKGLEFKKSYYDHDEHDSFDLCEDCIDVVCKKACEEALSDPRSHRVSINYASVSYCLKTIANDKEYKLLIVDNEYYYIEKTFDEIANILAMYLKYKFGVTEAKQLDNNL